MKLRVMSYNICSGRDFTADRQINLQAAAAVIRKYDPDVVGLNEVRGEGDDPLFTAQAQILGEALGYCYAFGPAIRFPAGPYGNALLSRFPILDAGVEIIPDPAEKNEPVYYETRAILRASVDLPGGLTVLVSHFGLAEGERKSAVAARRALRRRVKGPCIFMGDLNMTPEDPDLAPVRELFEDTARAAEEPLLTFPSWAPERKIDYIFTSGQFKALRAESPAETASDHRPYLAVLEF